MAIHSLENLRRESFREVLEIMILWNNTKMNNTKMRVQDTNLSITFNAAGRFKANLKLCSFSNKIVLKNSNSIGPASWRAKWRRYRLTLLGRNLVLTSESLAFELPVEINLRNNHQVPIIGGVMHQPDVDTSSTRNKQERYSPLIASRVSQHSSIRLWQ